MPLQAPDSNSPWWEGFTYQTIIAILGTLGTGFLAIAKWWESRSENRAKSRFQQEDWVIDNALELLEAVKDELRRVKEERDEERKQSATRIKECETDLRSANRRILELERGI